jgi:hypothetical protein
MLSRPRFVELVQALLEHGVLGVCRRPARASSASSSGRQASRAFGAALVETHPLDPEVDVADRTRSIWRISSNRSLLRCSRA